jgi:putative endopeptidase
MTVCSWRWLAIAALAIPGGSLKSQTTVSTVPTVLRVIDPAYMDTTVNACTDFFAFANGHWLKTDTIPAIYAEDGIARDMVDQNERVMRSLIDDLVAHRQDAPDGSTERKLGTFVASCMDSTAAEAQGLAPIQPFLDHVAAIRSRDALVPEIAELHLQGVNAVFNVAPNSAVHDAGHYQEWLTQAGLGLPDRDYYTDSGHAADSIRVQYVAHIGRLLKLAGATPADADRDAKRIMALETELAKASATVEALREPRESDHAMSVAALGALAPNVSWPVYFRAVGLTKPLGQINVAEPAFFRRVSGLMATTSLADWRAYLRFHLLTTAAPWLSTGFVNEAFAFQRLFTGATENRPRWKRCLSETDRDIGEALGKAYVDKTFSPEARARARAIIGDIRDAFGDRLRHLTWMSDATRSQALNKLVRMREKVGYPDVWRDYTRLRVDDGAFVLNVFGARSFSWQRVKDRPGTPVDTTEWIMTPPTVNAYNDITKNEMAFPAGALEPQTFDVHADDAANYGSLGAGWAGHELTHGFDDQGRHYDEHGNLRDWWTSADSARFVQQADLLVRQFDEFIQVDTLHVNGRLTLGENLADFGGLLTGYDAMERALVRDGRPGLIDGFTPEQRFFISYAQGWRAHARPAFLRLIRLTDVHAPDQWRVIGPLSDMPQFAQAFHCHPGDRMVRPDSLVARIW